MPSQAKPRGINLVRQAGQECPLHDMVDLRTADEVISKIQKAPERIAAGSMSDEMCPINCSVHTGLPEKGCA